MVRNSLALLDKLGLTLSENHVIGSRQVLNTMKGYKAVTSAQDTQYSPLLKSL